MAKKKNFNYFDYFIKNCNFICKAANFMFESLKSYDKNTFLEKKDSIHELENQADMCKHEMIEYLSHEFITPIEREDILALAQELDNVIDSIDDTMARIYMYNIDEIRPEAIKFAELVINCTKALKEAVAEFKNFKSSKSLFSKLIEVNNFESEGDNFHAKCSYDLFSTDTDTRTLLIWTTIYEDLEMCLDSCEDAVDIIESVVMKNS